MIKNLLFLSKIGKDLTKHTDAFYWYRTFYYNITIMEYLTVKKSEYGEKIVYWYRNFWMDVNHGSAHEL